MASLPIKNLPEKLDLVGTTQSQSPPVPLPALPAQVLLSRLHRRTGDHLAQSNLGFNPRHLIGPPTPLGVTPKSSARTRS